MKKWTKDDLGRFVAVAILVFLLVASVPVQAAKLQLPKGTDVKVKFAPGIKLSSGNLAKDTPLIISLAEPIMLGNITLVDAGAQGTAKVVEVKKAGGGGKPGYIKAEFIDLETKGAYKTTDGSKIKLTGFAEDKGSKKGFASIMRVILIGFLIKGGQGELNPEQIYTAQVAETVILEGE